MAFNTWCFPLWEPWWMPLIQTRSYDTQTLLKTSKPRFTWRVACERRQAGLLGRKAGQPLISSLQNDGEKKRSLRWSRILPKRFDCSVLYQWTVSRFKSSPGLPDMARRWQVTFNLAKSEKCCKTAKVCLFKHLMMFFWDLLPFRRWSESRHTVPTNNAMLVHL